jgi:glycosyltransferase involved in cell wall biosynthesis
MRVLFVTPSYFPIVGGSEVLTRALTEKLNDAGVHADIMTLNMNKKWYPSLKEVVTQEGRATIFKEPAINPFIKRVNLLYPLLRINVLPAPFFIRKLNSYDIIHFVGEADLSFPLFSLFVRKPKLLQCVGIFRRGGLYRYYTSERNLFRNFFTGLLKALANRFIISSVEEKTLLLNLGLPPGKVVIVPLGVDTAVFKPDLSKKRSNLILFVGRIDEIKGLHFLIEALYHVKNPIELAIIGPIWDIDYFKKIEELIKKVNKTGFHSVKLLGGMVQDELLAWYQKASFLVCPFVYETGSNVVRESLSCGTPVISSGCHLTDNGPDGILLSRNEPQELAEAIDNLLSNPDLRNRFGLEGRLVMEQVFSWNRITNNLIQLYTDMLKEQD